jgi:site-specific DNA recombinase
MKYFIYCRKSSEAEDRQVLRLDSQKKELRELATRLNLEIADVTFRESKSAKEPDNRPLFTQMIGRIRRGEARGILCWKLDRLARNPDEAGKIMGMLQREEIQHIKTHEKDYCPDERYESERGDDVSRHALLKLGRVRTSDLTYQYIGRTDSYWGMR